MRYCHPQLSETAKAAKVLVRAVKAVRVGKVAKVALTRRVAKVAWTRMAARVAREVKVGSTIRGLRQLLMERAVVVVVGRALNGVGDRSLTMKGVEFDFN